MRALSLFVLVWALAVAGALADYGLGTSYGTQDIVTELADSAPAFRFNTTPSTWFIDSVLSVLGALKNIIKYGLLLGTMARAFSPWPLPDVFVLGLNAFSVAVNAVAIIQFISGRILDRTA